MVFPLDEKRVALDTVLQRFCESAAREPWTLKELYATRRKRFLPMASTADYREYAAECLALAERVSNPLDRARLIEMAQDFLRIAEKQERSTR